MLHRTEDVEVADTMPDGWQRWLDWHRAIAPDNRQEIQTLETDRVRYLGYVHVVGRRRPDARLSDPIVSGSFKAAIDQFTQPAPRTKFENRP
jgi:hypothetical protein